MLEAYFRQLERHRPQERNIQSVSNWFMGTKPLVANESTFLNNWDDLVSPMRGVTCTGIETFVGNCAALIRRHWCSSVRKDATTSGSTCWLNTIGLHFKGCMLPFRRCIFREDSNRSAGRCQKVDRSASNIHYICSSGSGNPSVDKLLGSPTFDLSDRHIVQCELSSHQVSCHCALRHEIRSLHIFIESDSAHWGLLCYRSVS